MKVASFFAGIGGIDLGLERLGMETVFQCEWDSYCQKVLAKHWPEVKRHGDIRTLTADAIPDADVWAGGFPCQPFSLAGDRKASQDERHLWPVWFNLIRQVRPRYLLLENVPGLLSAEGGRVFGDLLRDLSSVGFDAEWDIVSAASVGAPHIRERLFILAYANRELVRNQQIPGTWSEGRTFAPDDGAEGRALPDTDGERCQESHVASEPGSERFASWGDDSPETVGVAHCLRKLQPQGSIQGERGWAGDSSRWSVEPPVCGVAYGIPNGSHRIRALGNAVVPQVVEKVGRRILELEAGLA